MLCQLTASGRAGPTGLSVTSLVAAEVGCARECAWIPNMAANRALARKPRAQGARTIRAPVSVDSVGEGR